MRKFFYFLIFGWWALIPIMSAQSQEVVTNFSLTNAVSKKTIALKDFSNVELVVVIFTSNYCPYSKLYEERIKNLAGQYNKNRVKFLLINPNDPDQSSKDAIKNMAERAQSKNFPFPYLADKEQKVAQKFNATKTPEVFLLQNKGNNFATIYKGAIDDNPQVPEDVREFYLKEAIEAALTGEPLPVKQTRPTGCIIKD